MCSAKSEKYIMTYFQISFDIIILYEIIFYLNNIT